MVATALLVPAALLCGQETTAAVQQAPQTPAVAPQIQPTHEQIADSLMAHQRYQAAIDEYRQAGDSVDSLNKMGVAFQLMFNLNEAERCYRAALRKDPKNSVSLNNMGSVYMARKAYSNAVRSYRKAVKLNANDALFHKNLGTALLAEHQYKSGWQAYQDALALDPEIFSHSSSVRVDNPSSVQDRGAMNFYMAKGCVKAGLPQRAVYYLRLSLNEGFTTPKKILADAELATLHDNPDFQQMMAAQGVYLTDPASARPAVHQ
jgi:tetratricopeptide (TPR) repeat protein